MIPPTDDSAWTVVKTRTSLSKPHRGRYDSASCNGEGVPFESGHVPYPPPGPDLGVTIETLHDHFARARRKWRHDAEAGVGAAGEWQSVISRIGRADPTTEWTLITVVCVALGRLSSSFVPREAAGWEDASMKRGRNKKGGDKQQEISRMVAGSARDTAMRQLVAIEEWISVLRDIGHMPHASAKQSLQKPDKEGDTSCRHAQQSMSASCTQSPRRSCSKIIQDPFINSLDAEFLRQLGWIVLPSTAKACRPAPEENPLREATLAPATSSTLRINPDNAAAHLTAHTLLFAPHAPHSVVRWLLTGAAAYRANRSSLMQSEAEAGVNKVSTSVPAVYIGNSLEELLETRAETAAARDPGAPLRAWLAARRSDTSDSVRRDRSIDDALADTWVYVYQQQFSVGSEILPDSL